MSRRPRGIACDRDFIARGHEDTCHKRPPGAIVIGRHDGCRQLGAAVPPAPLRRVARLSATFAAPTRLQLDGEEARSVTELQIEVVPGAIRVVTPVECGA